MQLPHHVTGTRTRLLSSVTLKHLQWHRKLQIHLRTFSIFTRLVLLRSGWLYQKAPISTSQKSLAGQQRQGLILWKRRFLTWHVSVVWRRVERDFCKLSWLLQINSSSLCQRQLVWHLNQIKQRFPSTSPLKIEHFHQIPIGKEGYRWVHLNPLLTQL